MEKNQNNITETSGIKSWEELTLADNFIFQKLMLNEQLCKKILSEILGKEVIKIEYPAYEKTIDVRLDTKGIRLDVYIRGEDEVYNIELQNAFFHHLPKRGRYYQSLIDLDLLEKGATYDELCQSYVIFINTFDFFGKNQYKYTFTYKCDEIPSLEYGDLTTMIMLNTLGTEGDISEDLKTFLKCINGVFSDDDFSDTIRSEFERIKLSREFRREYMTLEMELKKQFDDGERQGYAKGHADGLAKGHRDGLADGLAKGHASGRSETEAEDMSILMSLKVGESVSDIATKLNVPIEKVQKLYDLVN